MDSFDNQFESYEEIVSIDKLTVRTKNGEIKQVTGGEECLRQMKEAHTSLVLGEAVKLVSALQDEMVELRSVVEQLEEERTYLEEKLDGYLNYMATELKEELTTDFSEAICELSEGNDHLLMLVDSLADLQGVSPQDIILRAAEKARAGAVDRGSVGSSWSQRIEDGSHERNLRSVKGQGVRAGTGIQGHGDAGGVVKEHVEIDPRVEVYCRYLDNPVAMGGGYLSGRSKIVKFPNTQQAQQLSEEQEYEREEVAEVVNEIVSDMPEQKAAELLESCQNLEYDGDQGQLEEQIRAKRTEQESFDRKMAAFDRFMAAKAKGYVCK